VVEQLGVDYIAPYINLKSTVGLSQSPKAELAATTGYKDFTLGGLVSYDTAKSNVTAWTVLAGPPSYSCRHRQPPLSTVYVRLEALSAAVGL
jgi:hypothetical protein